MFKMLKILWFFHLFYATYGLSYFCNFPCGEQHTVCQREPCLVSSDCGKGAAALTMDDESRQWVLDIHNGLRNKLALGQDTRGGNEKAADMHVLNYDLELEFIAQCWANACSEGHDVCRASKKFPMVGQNMYSYGTTEAANFRDKIHIDNAVKGWYEEIINADAATMQNFHLKRGGSGLTIGHFTQVVWAKTTHVGCGRTQSNKGFLPSVYIYCNYGPAGNMQNAPVYQRGKPCSICGKEKCNSNYKGLCGTIKGKSAGSWLPPFRMAGSRLDVSLYTVVFLLVTVLFLQQYYVN